MRRSAAAQFVGQLAGAVGRVVVDHQHVGVRQLGVDAGDQFGQIVALVVGGDRDEQPQPLTDPRDRVAVPGRAAAADQDCGSGRTDEE